MVQVVAGACSLQVRKRALATVRLDGSSDSLKLRLDVSTRLSSADRKWRDRLLWFATEGDWLSEDKPL